MKKNSIFGCSIQENHQQQSEVITIDEVSHLPNCLA